MKIRLLIIIAAALLFFIYKFKFISPGEFKTNKTADSPIQNKTELPFTDKTFAFDYQSYPHVVENISIFATSETWTGSGFYDSKLFFEYPASLALAGADKNTIAAIKELKLDLGKVNNFELMVNLRTDPNDLETSHLIFADENLKTAKYAISKVHNGWEALKFTKEQFVVDGKFNWSKIVQVKFELTPRPFGKVVVNLASFRAFEDLEFSNDWNFVDPRLLILDKRQNKISLMARNMGAAPVGITIKKITTAANFRFQSSFSPLSQTWSGLFFRGNYLNGYGYYLMVNGIEGSQWQVYKVSKTGLTVLKKDIITDFQFKFGEWYYLAVEARDDTFSVYLSTDGREFKLLGIVKDSEYTTGGVGLTIGNRAVSLYNDFVFEQY